MENQSVIDKMNELVSKVGGKGRAAELLGVTSVTWYRWAHGQRAISTQVTNHIDLLLALLSTVEPVKRGSRTKRKPQRAEEATHEDRPIPAEDGR
jgi:hypothetical protein